MSEKLSEELLFKIGFRGEGKDITNHPAYRLEIPVVSQFEL
jgi:hypothetical protein